MKRTILYIGILGCLSGLFNASMGQEAANRKYTLAERSIQDARLNLPLQIKTEDPELTRQVHDLYIDCLFDKLWEPALPGLPFKWFSISGADDQSYGKCQLQWDPMFVLNAWAPLDDNDVVYDVFKNYWNVIDNNPEAPKGSYRYGMVPCTTNPDLPQPGFSQIPILAWGCQMVFNQTNDQKLLDLCLPYLDKFLTWYSTERDVDNDGLIEYGAYKESSIADLVQTARFETFDFHATLDELKLTKHPTRGTGGEWYGNVEGVDQTCFLAMSERAMIEMCKRTGRSKMMEKYERLLAKRTEAIRAKMWDPETKFFYSLNRDTDKKIRIRTLQGFLTLTAGLASEEQAGELVRQLTDPSLFWSIYPITTSAMDEPTFNPDGFWRGDMWPPTNYLIALGLQRYGYHDISKKLTDKMLELVKKYDGHSYERYNGVEGTDLGVKDYCWGVAIWSMIVHTTYGVQEDYRTIVMPPHAKGRRLKLGKLEVNYLTDNTVELKSAFKREFKVVFPEKTTEIKVQCDGKIVKSANMTDAPYAAMFTAMPGKTYIVSGDHKATLSSKDQGLKLSGNRFFTFSTVVRVNQIEVTRDKNEGVDESGIHSPEAARKFRETIDKCWPGARITWTFSWLALKDQRPNYREIRELVVTYHKKYGDEITFLPGGYFANMYNSREQVNRDLHEGLQMVSAMVGGGYRPKSVVAGFLSAENQRFLAEEEGIHVCQGNIWSQYAVDNGDGEGSVSYPYYLSREHFCKPAQGKEDMIDCVNLDGWTVDFLMARYAAPRFINGIRCGSRQGVGPIETILRQGIELGTKEILATTAAHFDTGFKLNNFAWVTCIWELGLVDLEQRDRKTRTGLDGLEIWLNEMRRRWPEAKCITHGEFGMLWREQFKNNDSIDYRFVMRGTGVCGSEPELEIRWFMNKDFRLAFLRNWQENGPEKLIDFTRYDLPAKEPVDPQPGETTRNWSLMNRLNQKGTRPQDQPITIDQLNEEERAIIRKRYPELVPDNSEKSRTPVMKWDFETIQNRTAVEKSANISDTIEGIFEWVEGVTGKGLRLDGFTTRVIRDRKDISKPGDAFTIEAWVALGEYPLNWCPVITTESNETKGYRLLIGPYGQVSFETAIGEQWIACTSANEILPLRKWMHIAGVYTAQKEMTLYVNGEPVSTLPITGSLTFPAKPNCIIGMAAFPGRPSNTIRTWGTVEAYYGLDGIIDEISVFDAALTPGQVKGDYVKHQSKVPDIQPRRLPTLEKNPGRFGAFYTKLKYYPGWDNLWPVDQDPDVVVCFDKNPVKLIFWRGARYGPAWVSENENWMADQSLETWGNGENDIEGCFEHMQDRHCRFSHVRIIENSDARAVVHWRYALVSAYDHTWMPDPKTGWECWVDEYYYIYPDGSAIRKVSWNKGTTGNAIQYQESLPFTQPGQRHEELLENKYVTVADYDFQTADVYVDPPKQPVGWTGKYTIQQYNFKSENKPFICFEPGNDMWVRWIGGGYNHFPVNQARSDGRWAKTTDRPTHFMSSPCSDPIIHEEGNRLYWIGLYGMNNLSLNELIAYGRSWAYAPELTVTTTGYISKGYDNAERCYQLEKNNSKAGTLEFTLKGSKDSPVINPAIRVKNWNSAGARILVNSKQNGNCKIGINHQLEGDDLLIYIPLKEMVPVKITIVP